ncbi:hypothetical protein [Methylomonas methanica]|uniref:Uncharacterized protein n=1 Tax=Methylomonas methanica TaxID=421 RepID=A0A177LUV1_METMH|nr:hypothetical protein [Methylomonas methanica]OAH97257.1 hypothetical protein A1332_21555 [Methylomonas methanica]
MVLIDSAVTTCFLRFGVRVFYRILRIAAFTTASGFISDTRGNRYNPGAIMGALDKHQKPFQ